MDSQVNRSIALAALALVVGCTKSDGAREGKAKSVVLITIDTLRADHLSCYGYGKPTSPFLDSFAKESARFEHAIVPVPRTTQSLASLLTGLYPQRTKVRSLNDKLDSSFETLAERFAAKGFVTGAFVEIPFLLPGRPQGLAQGFKEQFHYDPAPGEWRAEELTKRALAWIEQQGDRPFFLWLHYRDPHAPYWPPDPFKNRFDPQYPIDGSKYDGPLPEYFHYWPVDESFQMVVPPGATAEELRSGKEHLKFGDSPLLTPRYVERAIALYDGEIAYTDHALKQLYDGLHTSKVADSLVTVLTADHGESLGEHRFYFDHGEFLYDTCLRVPLIIEVPGFPTRAIPDLVGTIDIAPTLVELFGLEPMREVQGRSLVPLLRGDPLPRVTYFAESGEPLFPEGNPRFKDLDHKITDPLDRLRGFVPSANLKLIWDPTRAEEDSIQVFHTDEDPGEVVNRAKEYESNHRLDGGKAALHGLHGMDKGVKLSEVSREQREALNQAGYTSGGNGIDGGR